MIVSKLQNQEKPYSQMAGILYLLIAIIGGFSIGYMPSQILAEENAPLTFQNLLQHQTLFRWGLTGDIAVMTLEVILTVMLYQLFKFTSSTAIIIATYSRIAMAIIMGLNLINYIIPAIIMNQPDYLNVFSTSELESLSHLFLKVHKYGELTWQIFFSIHLFTLGYVILKAQITPKWLGIIMLLGSVGYWGDSFIQLVFIKSETLSLFFSGLLFLAVVSELWFAFWLLIKGVKTKIST